MGQGQERMWAQGSQRGLERLGVIKSDIEALNQRWLKLIKRTSMHDHRLTIEHFGVQRSFANLCAGASDPILGEAAKVGVPLFQIGELASFCADLAQVRAQGRLPSPPQPEDPHVRRLMEERSAIGYAYLALVREMAGREPVLAIAMLGIDERLLALANCTVDDLTYLSRAHSMAIAPRHSESLAAQLQVLQADQMSCKQRAIIRSWFLLTELADEAPVSKISEPTLASDPLGQMLNITGLAALGCRINVSVALTHARKPLVRQVMTAAGIPVEDKGGRKPSRIASLIESTATHVASSFFLQNYTKARQRFGSYAHEPEADAFLTAMAMSRNTGLVTDLDPDLALLITQLFHQGEVTTARCVTCSSTYLAATTPVQIKRDVAKGDCPICREVHEMQTGRKAVRLFGRKSRLNEILDLGPAEQTRLALD